MRQEGRGGIGPVDKIWRRQVVHGGVVARGGGTVAGRWRRRGGGGGGTVAAAAPAGDVVDPAALCVDGRRAPCKRSKPHPAVANPSQ